MYLNYVGTYLNPDDYPRELRSDFGFRSRYLGSFLSRRVKMLRFDAVGFNAICIQGRKLPEDACPLRSENAAVPFVAFDQQRYASIGPGEHHEFFIQMTVEGLERCAKFHRIPIDDLMAAIEEFRRDGYKNEWTHQKKLLRAVGLQASLVCRMDTDRFTLNLVLERKGSTVFDEQILETKPDEIIFAHRFKDVVVDGDEIVVNDKFGRPLFSMPASSVGAVPLSPYR